MAGPDFDQTGPPDFLSPSQIHFFNTPLRIFTIVSDLHSQESRSQPFISQESWILLGFYVNLIPYFTFCVHRIQIRAQILKKNQWIHRLPNRREGRRSLPSGTPGDHPATLRRRHWLNQSPMPAARVFPPSSTTLTLPPPSSAGGPPPPPFLCRNSPHCHPRRSSDLSLRDRISCPTSTLYRILTHTLSRFSGSTIGITRGRTAFSTEAWRGRRWWRA